LVKLRVDNKPIKGTVPKKNCDIIDDLVKRGEYRSRADFGYRAILNELRRLGLEGEFSEKSPEIPAIA